MRFEPRTEYGNISGTMFYDSAREVALERNDVARHKTVERENFGADKYLVRLGNRLSAHGQDIHIESALHVRRDVHEQEPGKDRIDIFFPSGSCMRKDAEKGIPAEEHQD